MGTKYKDKIFAPKELALHLADCLVDRGHNVYLYAAPGTRTKAKLFSGEEDLIKHDFIGAKVRGFDRISKEKTAHLATKMEYEIDLTVKAYIHAKEMGLQVMHSYHDFMAHYINKLIDVPTVYTLHDPRPRPEHLEYWRFKHFKNDNYIFISQSQIRNFRHLVKVFGLAYHGVKISEFPFSKTGGEYLGFIGRYIKEKGVDLAIHAAQAAKIPLRMIGDDAYRVLPYYQKKIKPHLKKRVVEDETFFGEADRGEFLKNAKAILFPILWEEPFGMVMIEAMACGTPVIAFDRGSVHEVIKDGETGFIVDPKEGLVGFEKAVRRMRDLPGVTYQGMRVACRKRVEENFTVEKMAEHHEKLYEKAIGK